MTCKDCEPPEDPLGSTLLEAFTFIYENMGNARTMPATNIPLPEFLRERIDEEIELAKSATQGTWEYDPDTPHVDHANEEQNSLVQATSTAHKRKREFVAVTGHQDSTAASNDAHHIAYWEPARVKKEAEFKLFLLDKWEPYYTDSVKEAPAFGFPGADDPNADFDAREILKNMARAYQDHPDFREEWSV